MVHAAYIGTQQPECVPLISGSDLRREACDAQGIRRAPQASPPRRVGRGWSASGTRSSPTPPEAGVRPRENDTHSSDNRCATLVIGIAVLSVTMR